MKALLLRLSAPLQSWGVQSRFSERDTQLEPSKSGVIGLVAAALGRDRAKPLDDLAALLMGVRVDSQGRKFRDYHTVGGGTIPTEALRLYGVRSYGVARANSNGTETALSRRFYLSDARFLVALAGEDTGLLERIADAFRRPVFPLFLGRKSCVPSEPILFNSESPLVEGNSLATILESAPWEPLPHEEKRLHSRPENLPTLRMVLEDAELDPGEEVGFHRPDQPVSFVKTDRRFTERTLRVTFTDKPPREWLARHTAQEAAS